MATTSDVNSVGMGIQDFYQTAQDLNFTRDFSLRVLSISPGAAAPTVSFDTSDLIYIKAAQLPARGITNVEVPYMGLKFNVPGTAFYPNSDAYEVVFYADANSSIRELFEDWSRSIFDDATSTGNYFVPGPDAIISLVQLDAQLNAITQYNLIGASVRNVGALEYKIAEGTGQTLEFTATISYHYWTRIVSTEAPS